MPTPRPPDFPDTSQMSVTPAIISADWYPAPCVFVFCHWLIPCLQHRASPRNAHAFTGFSGNSTRDGPGGPSGTLLLAVTNSAIPCTLEGMSAQKFVSFTVLNIRKKGWIYAPWCVILFACLFSCI